MEQNKLDEVVYSQMLRLKLDALNRRSVDDPAVREQYFNSAANLKGLAARMEGVLKEIYRRIDLDELQAQEQAQPKEEAPKPSAEVSVNEAPKS